MRRSLLPHLALIAALLPAALPAAAQAPAGAKAAPPALPVETAAVRQGPIDIRVDVVGSLRANEMVVLRPEVAGRVAEIGFAEGGLVKKGQTLVNLDAAEWRAQLAEAEAAVQLAQANHERATDLHQRQFISRASFDDTRSRLAEARAREQLARVRLAKATLKAPFGGVVGLRAVSPGDYVKEGQDLVTLVDIATLKMDFRIPEIYLPRIKVGQEIRVRVDAFPGELFAGKVYAVDPRIDEQTRTVLLSATLPNADHRLRPGMFARSSQVLYHQDAGLLVPEEAIVPLGEERYVFRVVDGQARRVKVRIGQRLPGEVEILEGLSAGDVVVRAGQIKLRDGAPVKAVGAPAEKPAAAPATKG